MIILKKIYVVRHCEAIGQAPEAPLTEKGTQQAIQLADFLMDKNVEQILASPYERAIQTIQPLANSIQHKVDTDERLIERVLCSEPIPDWFERLRDTYEDFDLKFSGGESSREAMSRIVEVVEEVFASSAKTTVLVTHGGLMSLLLHHIEKNFGFEGWQSLRNPDVYLLARDFKKTTYERIWK
ncbi:histidine phosphatase family protein [Fredinandcohnia sp. 179-A 10B2 NHS]|uniref:histidine phosphatase family protein n=1 Tax=Fredinandcohnia sp. 179-A 10B2 NHS TaxID=3235176 RepID=UPI0039A0CD03